MRIPMVVASVALLACTVAACGGDGSGAGSDYCKELKRSKASISGTVEASDMDWADNVKALHTLADKAPDEIGAEWKTLDGGITTFEKRLKDAGLKMSDMDRIFSGDTSGIDPDAMEKLGGDVMSALGTDEFAHAWDVIVKNAKDVCKVEMD